MKSRRIVLAAGLCLAVFEGMAIVAAEPPADRALLDARVVRRITEVGDRDIPRELLGKMIREDIEALRGRKPDGTYEFAHYVPDEASRTNKEFSLGPDGTGSGVVFADFAYSLVITIPSRRMLVRRNAGVWIDKVDIETTSFEGESKIETIELAVQVPAGKSKTIDLGGVMRKARATVYAHVEGKTSSVVTFALVIGSVEDNHDSPYGEAVRSAKRIQELLSEKGDSSSIISAARSMERSLERYATAPATVAATAKGASSPAAPRSQPKPEPQAIDYEPGVVASDIDSSVYDELTKIEDLMLGTEAERLEGLRRLRQLVRKMKPSG